jgi:LacI family transcriptional regulator
MIAKPPKNRPVSLKCIAELAGTSTCTVSKVLNDVSGYIVSESKRKSIREAAIKLGYRPNRAARMFSTGRLDCIGLAIGPGLFALWGNRPTASLTMETLQGVTERLAELNHTVMLSVLPESGLEDALRRAFLSEQRVDGLITLLELPGSLAAEMESHGIPCASAIHYRPTGAHRAVGLDTYPGVRDAVRRLAELGHRRVGYVGYREGVLLTGSAERQALYLSLSAEYGIRVDPEFAVPAMDETEAYKATRLLAAKPNLPSCLIYSADHFAITGMRALLEAGKRVPQDVSVVGFDDARYASASPVPLSTIRVPRKEIGRAVAQWVVDLKHDPGAHPGSMMLASEWVERASTGPARHG